MPSDSAIQDILHRPGTFVFPSNLAALTSWSATDGFAIRQPTGHLVMYGSHGRRVLATDPEGHPLHECDWEVVNGAPRLLRARLRLDWNTWIGLIPGGLVNTMKLDLSRKPGWERLRTDDLRNMAAQAMQVPLEEVRFFYNDQDMTIEAGGVATIRHRKDALFVLADGTFERTQFMACMGAMHWESIDFLPVVELFLSLLPGTGSTMFELIRGLYDDQNQSGAAVRPLRYRGIPTYPSEAAYRLFSGFFDPQVSGGGDPLPLFMDPPRSHLVKWLPTSQPPRRYFDEAHQLCVTIQGPRVVKATRWNDPTGLSYQPFDGGGVAPCQRGLGVDREHLLLVDRADRQVIPLNPRWGTVTHPPMLKPAILEADWSSVFEGPAPCVSPDEAFGAVLLYPDNDRDIEELPTQPFVADYLQDLIADDRLLAAQAGRAVSLMVSGFDAVIMTCIGSGGFRTCTVLYDYPAFAQRQAQMLWNAYAREHRLDRLAHVRMRARGGKQEDGTDLRYDLAYEWIPFELYHQPEEVRKRMETLTRRLMPNAVAFVVGPPSALEACRAIGMQIQDITPVMKLPTVRLHQSILPRAQVKAGVTLYQLKPR